MSALIALFMGILARFVARILEENNRHPETLTSTTPADSTSRRDSSPAEQLPRGSLFTFSIYPGYYIHVSMSAFFDRSQCFGSWYCFGTGWHCVVQCSCTSSKIKCYPISVIHLHFLYYISIRFVFGTVGTALGEIDIHIFYN